MAEDHVYNAWKLLTSLVHKESQLPVEIIFNEFTVTNSNAKSDREIWGLVEFHVKQSILHFISLYQLTLFKDEKENTWGSEEVLKWIVVSAWTKQWKSTFGPCIVCSEILTFLDIFWISVWLPSVCAIRYYDTCSHIELKCYLTNFWLMPEVTVKCTCRVSTFWTGHFRPALKQFFSWPYRSRYAMFL